MTNDLKISRELAERLTRPLVKPEDFNVRIAARVELRTLLANHSEEPLGAVEPVEAILLSDCVELNHKAYGAGYFSTEVTMLYASPPELAELQATIARLETQVANAINLDFDRRAEIERLKGGQGEAFGWMRFDVDGNPYRCRQEDHGDAFPVYRSPPAPVAVVLPERMEIPDFISETQTAQDNRQEIGEALGHNACLDKVKEMNR